MPTAPPDPASHSHPSDEAPQSPSPPTPIPASISAPLSGMSAGQRVSSGRSVPVRELRLGIDDFGTGSGRLGWLPGFAGVLLPVVSWVTALVFLISFGVLLIYVGDREARITGVLVVTLGVVASVSAAVLGYLFWRRRRALRTLKEAHSQLRGGQETQAIASLNRLLADNRLPEIQHLIRFLLGRALHEAGRQAEAIEEYRRCGHFWPAFHNLALIHCTAENWEKAEAAFKLALHVNPHEPLLYNHLALVQQTMGEPILARQTLEACLKIAPASKATRRNLDRLDIGESIDTENLIPRLRSLWQLGLP